MPTSASRPRRRSTETLQLVVTCCGTLGMLAGFPLPLVSGPIGLILIVGLAMGTGLHIFISLRAGRTIARALVEVGLVGLLAFGLTYGCIWYFTVYLAAQPDLWKFNIGVPTPSPVR